MNSPPRQPVDRPTSPRGGQACLLDGNGVVVWINEAWQRSGPPFPAAGLRPGDRYPDACRRPHAARFRGADAVHAALTELLRGHREFFEAECTGTIADDRPPHHVHVRGQTIVIDGRRCAFVTHEDVSATRTALQALHASEQRYRHFFEAAPDPVFLISAEPEERGRILDANERACQLHGYTREQLLAMTIGELDGPEDAALVGERIARLRKQGTIEFRAVHIHREGHEIPVEISARMTTVAGRACVLSFNRDVRDRTRVEAELRQNRFRFEVAARASGIGFWEWDVSTNAVHYSDEWKAQLGYAPDEIVNDFEEWRSRVHPDDLQATLDKLDAHLTGELPVYTTEFRLRHKDGSWRWIDVRGEARRGRDGAVESMFGCHVDVTARKQAELERESLSSRLQQLQRLESMGTLAGGIAHDFNNILSIISGNVELALLDAEDPALRESLDEVQKASRRARALVRQILTFSRDEPPQLRRVALAGIVEEAARFVRSTTPRRVQVTCDIGADVPDVSADAEQLHQVLINLGTNAWHAIGDRDGTVAYRLTAADSADGPCASIEIVDDGVGIPESDRARIFEPFFTTKGPGKGTGLGLSVVHGIVQNHGGTIEVASAPGDGTTFRILLPRCDVAADAPGHLPATAARHAPRVLLLDDEQNLLSVLSRGLVRLGIHVTGASTGDEALALLRRAPTAFDVLVTDLDMPRKNGFEVAREARALRPDLPIVLCSGFMDTSDSERAAAAGVTATLTKPITTSELAEQIRHLCAPSSG